MGYEHTSVGRTQDDLLKTEEAGGRNEWSELPSRKARVEADLVEIARWEARWTLIMFPGPLVILQPVKIVRRRRARSPMLQAIDESEVPITMAYIVPSTDSILLACDHNKG